jgi:hypothetical protein
MSFTITDPPSGQGENTWFTPKIYIDALGPFDLDPCTVSYAPFATAKTVFNHDLGECGIAKNWHGDVWLNPPYGREIGPFIDKFICHKLGCMLVFARMDSRWLQKLLRSGAYVFCLRKRIKFISKALNGDTNAGTGSCLVFFDEKYIARANLFEGVLIKKFEVEK